MSVVAFPDIFIVHYAVITAAIISTMIFIGHETPFASSMRNKAEVLEQLAILVIIYHIFCFTDWLPDLFVRHNLGYSLISCIVL